MVCVCVWSQKNNLSSNKETEYKLVEMQRKSGSFRTSNGLLISRLKYKSYTSQQGKVVSFHLFKKQNNSHNLISQSKAGKILLRSGFSSHSSPFHRKRSACVGNVPQMLHSFSLRRDAPLSSTEKLLLAYYLLCENFSGDCEVMWKTCCCLVFLYYFLNKGKSFLHA